MKIALDVDDVLAAFTPHAHSYFKVPFEGRVNYWCEKTMDERLGNSWFHHDIALNHDFWHSLPVLTSPDKIDFDFDCYITALPDDLLELRLMWLRAHGFPERPVIISFDKLQTCIERGIDILIDDKPQTIEKLQGSPVRGLHFINHYAGFEPIGDFITCLSQVKEKISIFTQPI